MLVYSNESMKGPHSKFTFMVFFDGRTYRVEAKRYRIVGDSSVFTCVYHNAWERLTKSDLLTHDYDGMRLGKIFKESSFFVET